MGRTYINENGFTYLEAMIVVIMIGLFTTMALPAFENIIARERLKAAARTITIHFREIQQLAIAKEQVIKIVFNDKNNSTEANSYLVKSGVTIIERKTLANKIHIKLAAFSGKELTFNTLGNSKPGHLELENSRGDNFYVIVNSVGRVRTSNVPPAVP